MNRRIENIENILLLSLMFSLFLGGCYLPQPSASVDNILLDLHNSSHHSH